MQEVTRSNRAAVMLLRWSMHTILIWRLDSSRNFNMWMGGRSLQTVNPYSYIAFEVGLIGYGVQK